MGSKGNSKGEKSYEDENGAGGMGLDLVRVGQGVHLDRLGSGGCSDEITDQRPQSSDGSIMTVFGGSGEVEGDTPVFLGCAKVLRWGWGWGI